MVSYDDVKYKISGGGNRNANTQDVWHRTSGQTMCLVHSTDIHNVANSDFETPSTIGIMAAAKLTNGTIETVLWYAEAQDLTKGKANYTLGQQVILYQWTFQKKEQLNIFHHQILVLFLMMAA